MTRQCCECRKIRGERCKDCGARAIIYQDLDKSILGWRLVRRAVCTNVLCSHSFEPGEGGTSHGLCTSCFDRQMAELEALYGPEVKRVIRPLERVAA